MHGLPTIPYCELLRNIHDEEPYTIHQSYMEFSNVTWLCYMAVLNFSDKGQTVFSAGASEVTSFSATS